MTDLDLERLGDVWRQQPDPDELEELRRTAEAGRRRARWAQLIDVVAALLVAGIVLLLAMRRPQLDTLIVGGGAVLLLLLSHIRQRRLRMVEIRSLTGGTEEMLDQAIARVEATLRRTRFQLIGFVPAILIGLAFAYVATRGAGEMLSRISSDPWLRFPLLAAAGISLVAMAAHLNRSIRRGRQELQRLVALRDSYRHERESSLSE